MNGKKIIQNILMLLAWVLVGSGLMVLLIAANRKEALHVCKELRISIKGDGEQFFVDKNDILSLLNKSARGSLIDKPLDQINLSKLEHDLERGVWIRDAELYFDSRDVLHVLVTEREPVARIFTKSGASFYIDSSGQRMPLLEKENARVLLITNFTNAKKFTKQDSALARDVKSIAQVINGIPFWREQIAQIDITPEGKYEALPVVGNHMIRFGNAVNFSEKLNRLFLFYKQVLCKVGFDKYDIVDVQYNGQVLGVHKDGATAAVDSVQLSKNIADLLARSHQQMSNDSLVQIQQSASAVDTTQRPAAKASDETIHPSNPIPSKSENPDAVRNRKSKSLNHKTKPKAVMPPFP